MALTKTSLIQDGAVTQDKISGNVNLGGPKIANVSIANSSYTILDDTAVDTAGGYLVITGTGFESGAQVIINQTPALSTTYVNSTTLRAQVDSANAATYNVYVVNPDGGTATRINGLTYSGTPTWVTASTLSNVVNATAFTGTFEATGATSYANTTALPSGFNLVTANGYYYGNIEVGSDTTYNFTISAIDDELQNSDRSFDLFVSTAPPTLTTDILVVAGGGAGGGAYDSVGGGGGAGGLLYGTSINLSRGTTYTITVGSGGVGSNASLGSNGSNSVISTTGYTAIAIGGGGGGGGPRGSTNTGRGGGSGGGGIGFASYTSGGVAQQGNSGGLTGYGYSGSAGTSGPGTGGAGGGAIENGGTDGIGYGGDGRSYDISGTSQFYAGGGAGGTSSPPGGDGGGGNGGAVPSTPPTAGGVNTGGGGGGTHTGAAGTGASGGSGVVIIRYSDTEADAVSTTGSPTYTNTGGYKIYKFTGSGSITW